MDASDSTARAHHIRHAIKIARTLHQLRNFNSLKAVVTALRTPPIARLKRSWAQVPRKYQVALDELRTLVSEDENYARYRSAIGNAVRPAVPFLGVILHDLTYAVASNKLVLERRRTEEAGGAGGGRDLDSAAGSSTMPIDNDALLASLLHEPGETSTVGYSSGHVRSVLFSFEYFQCGPTYDDDARFGQCGSRQHSQGFTRKLMGGGSGGGGGDVYHSASDMRGHYRDHSHHGQTAHSSSSTTATSTPATSATNARTPGPEDLACDRAFCLHWLLTRPYIPSRAIDDLSRKREPPRTSVTSINAVLLRDDKDRPTTASSNGSVEQVSQSRSSSPRSMSLSTMASSPTRQHLSVDNLAVPGSSGFLFPPPPPLPSSASMADVSISRSPRKVGQPTSIVKPSSGSRVNKLLHVIGLEVERRDDGKRTVRRAKAASMDALAEKGQQQQQHFGEEVRGGECDDDDDDAYGIAGGSSDGASPTKSPGSG